MKADSTAPVDESDAGVATTSTSRVSDPFAVDLFASSREAGSKTKTSAADETFADDETIAARRIVRWDEHLPRYTLAQARLSATLETFTPNFSTTAQNALVRVLAHYTRVSPAEVSLAFVDLHEKEFEIEAQRTENDSRVWISLSIEPTGARIAAELDLSFASDLIDRLVGGAGSASPLTLRLLSITERALLEFLWLCLIREMNLKSGEPVWTLNSIGEARPAWLAASTTQRVENVDETHTLETRATNGRGLFTALRVRAGALAGIVRFHLTRDALLALDAAQNPLWIDESANEAGARLVALKRLTPDIALHVGIGTTEAAASDLQQLEAGDVVVIARPTVKRHPNGSFKGRVEVRAGDAMSAALVGTVGTSARISKGAANLAPPTEEGSTIELMIETIKSGERPPATERLKMQEEAREEEQPSDEGGIALEELMLTVHVELAARRISLAELTRLRVGQLLELGCQATDPVQLVSEGRTLARGELIDIEGRLGVRVTQLMS
jgi:type III secretion protein Q